MSVALSESGEKRRGSESFEYPAPKLFIAGQWRMGRGGDTIPVRNPATGATIAQLPVANKDDLDEALAAVHKTFVLWRSTSAYDRGKILRKAADLMRERARHIGQVTTTEQGKVLAESSAEAFYFRRHFRLVCRGGASSAYVGSESSLASIPASGTWSSSSRLVRWRRSRRGISPPPYPLGRLQRPWQQAAR